MVVKEWNVAEFDKEQMEKMRENCRITKFLSLMLNVKGICETEQIVEFFADKLSFDDPFLIKDMDKAVSRINEAIEKKERICIYGDYDADGITATATLYDYLQNRGANVTYYIPNRFTEGYGMNNASVEKISKDKVSLIITVDNGIVAFEQIELASSLGIDTVVTDHHKLKEDRIPEAVAVINPHRPDCGSPYKDYAGVGVAFNLLLALENDKNSYIDLFKKYGCLVCIGTIADIVPLTGKNRNWVRCGLTHFSKNCTIGLRSLCQEMGLDVRAVNSMDIGFKIAPRINATGRLNRTQVALDLLLCSDYREARRLAEVINAINERRKDIGGQIEEEVEAYIEANPQVVEKNRIIIVAKEDLHTGVIGIIASKIARRYGKPAIIISKDNSTGIATASGRSIIGFSLFSTVSSVSDMLIKFGGHDMAVGFSLKNEDIELLTERLNDNAKENHDRMPTVNLSLECKISPMTLNYSFAEEITYLEPFGEGNRKPLVGLFGLQITEIIPLSQGKHNKLILTKGTVTIEVMDFFCETTHFKYKLGDVVDIAVNLEVSQYKKSKSLLTIVREFRYSKFKYTALFNQKHLFFKFITRETPRSSFKRYIPTREDFAVVYKYLSKEQSSYKRVDNILYYLQDDKIGYFKFNVILQAMYEVGLIDFQKKADKYKITMKEKPEQKVDLDNSEIMKYIKGI